MSSLRASRRSRIPGDRGQLNESHLRSCGRAGSESFSVLGPAREPPATASAALAPSAINDRPGSRTHPGIRMSGGFVLSLDDRLFRRAAEAIVERGGGHAVADLGGGMVQYADAVGRLFTLFERVPAATEWEVREGPLAAAEGVRLPDMQAVVACPFECRSPDLAVELADAIARTTEAPTWVLDGDGVVWDAEAVDPFAVRL